MSETTEMPPLRDGSGEDATAPAPDSAATGAPEQATASLKAARYAAARTDVLAAARTGHLDHLANAIVAAFDAVAGV